jgi:hypothetical protein
VLDVLQSADVRVVVYLREEVELNALVHELLLEVVDVVEQIDLLKLVLERVVSFPVPKRRVR